jgi:hypothetical protein
VSEGAVAALAALFCKVLLLIGEFDWVDVFGDVFVDLEEKDVDPLAVISSARVVLCYGSGPSRRYIPPKS